MDDYREFEDLAFEAEPGTASAGEGEGLAPLPIRPFLAASGVYSTRRALLPERLPERIPFPLKPVPKGKAEEEDEVGIEEEEAAAAPEEESADFFFPFDREELRLDVDGRYPQMAASGTMVRGFGTRVNWVARLRAITRSRWRGAIWYQEGGRLPYTSIDIVARRSFFPHQRLLRVTFRGPGGIRRRRIYHFARRWFNSVDFEFDKVSNAEAVTEIDTTAHPNHPAILRHETLSIEDVFARAGFRVTSRRGSVPLSGAGSDLKWTNAEMHDAMQTYWSRFANRPQWALWVLFAREHVWGHGLGGIMFDDIGPNERQGTAIFSHSFIADPPPGDPAPDAWVKRMRFWTAVHELGHGFNLAHAWQKHLGTPWIPLVSDPEARSFMNYPYRVSGGERAFFADFAYRFSDPELLFMRHAPRRFVEMGNAAWFDRHGFENVDEEERNHDFALELVTDKAEPVFEFLEPVTLTLRLTNATNEAKLVPRGILSEQSQMTVVIKKEGAAARQWVPYARYFMTPQTLALEPGESIEESLFVAAGRNGWDLAEPGRYLLQVAIGIDGRTVLSNPLVLRVARPKSREQEVIAQDFFSDEVGRVMAFDGSRVLDSGNAALRKLVESFPDSAAAIHAEIALAMPELRVHRLIEAEKERLILKTVKPDLETAQKAIERCLFKAPALAAATLSHVDYAYYGETFSALLAEEGQDVLAKKVEKSMETAMTEVAKAIRMPAHVVRTAA